jgi:hypothetical protein
VPCRSVWDSGANVHPFQQRSHEPDSSIPGGPPVSARGPSDWMLRRHVRRGDDRRGREDSQNRCHYIVKLCGMARRNRRKEGAVCGKPGKAIQALAQMKRENRDTARVRFRVGTRGEDGALRHPSGVSALSARSADERLVLVQVRQVFLQVHGPSVRLGLEPDVVYSTNVPTIRKLRHQYRVLAYLNDFLICPVKARRVASMRDFRKATQVIDKLLSSVGLTRHPKKGE